MSASLQYNITYQDVGAIFDQVFILDNNKVQFVRESSESKYTMEVDLTDVFTQVLEEYDFDYIAELRSDMEMYENAGDTEKFERDKQILTTEYGRERLENYDEFKGNYEDYAKYFGQKMLDAMDEFAQELTDATVFVETWL